jgi:hypothetical protein
MASGCKWRCAMDHRRRAQPPPRIVWFILLVAKLVVSCNDAIAEAAVEWIEQHRRDTAQLFLRPDGLRKDGLYKCQARVDQSAGKATSLESSTVLRTTKLGAFLEGSRDIGQACHRASNHLFCEYPVWLCRGASTFGLLQAVPHERSRRQGAPNGYDIRIRIVGVTLLKLGPPKSRARFSSSFGKGLRLIEHTVDLPITGGIMALKSSNYNGGSLRFTLQVWREKNNDCQRSLYKLVTSIHGYRPALCGPSPISPLRSTLYLLTQSPVHAHVMWRFHRYCCNASF